VLPESAQGQARWLEEAVTMDGKPMRCARRLMKARPALDADAGWTDVTVAGLVIRCAILWISCRIAGSCARRSPMANPESLALAFTPDAPTVAVPHRDHGLALLSAASVALSVLACCGFWIATGWPDGVTAPLFALSSAACSPVRMIPFRHSAISTGIPRRHRGQWNLRVWYIPTDHGL